MQLKNWNDLRYLLAIERDDHGRGQVAVG